MVVSVHRSEEVGRGLLLRILKDAGLMREEFLKLLRS
jgi:predicted RNA binding protein YcfA (HicA-like mRNA interferase family)